MSENVVLIVMDTVRARALFSADGPAVRPISEDDSERGVSFEEAVAPAPWTLPSHASLFTGAYPSAHGAHAAHKFLEDDVVTLPEILNENGYETVAVSNNTWISEEFGFGRGFETFYKTWQYVQSDTDFGRIAQTEHGVSKLREGLKTLFDGNPLTNLANAIYGQYFRKNVDDGAARTNAWLERWLDSRGDSRPFFLFINYLEPHLEYRPPKQHAAEYLPDGVSYDEAMEVPQDAWGYIAGDVELSDADFDVLRGLYRAEISYLSEKIAEVVELLRAAGEWEETVFIVTSDHGENIGEHGLMDHQYALYDTLLHVPLYVQGGPFRRDSIDDLVQLVDLPPTILDMLDIDAPKAREQFQGISFHPESDESREYAIAEYVAPQPSMDALEKRVGDLSERVRKYDRSLRAVRTDRYKYVRGSDGRRELYDIRSDSNEVEDISPSNPDVVDRLETTLENWLDSFEHAERAGDVSMSDDAKDRLEDLGYLQ